MTEPVALSRWLGGKRWLTTGYPEMLPLPRRGRRAYDVFAGSCVVALWWLAQGYRVVIGDTNARLIGCLRNLRERADAVIGTLAAEAGAYRDAADQRADFYQRRDHLNRVDADSLEGAALFLFVLRAGFNGLWRENSRGLCNTTWGEPAASKNLVREDELRAVARLLQNADVRLGDFAQTSDDARSGDALFADAPYVAPGAFVNYSKAGFSLLDRQRLAAHLRALDHRGVRWTATDAATDHTLATYGLWTVDRVQVRRNVACKASARGDAEEVLVRNWHSRKAAA